MTGRRRQVVATPVITAVAVAIVFSAVGNLMVVGCIVAWLRQAPEGSFASAITVFTVAAAAHIIAGGSAMLAWLWSR